MWKKIKRFFKDSETIFLARLQLIAGVVIEALIQADPAVLQGFIPTKWFGLYLIGAGILIEIARRLRDPQLGKGE